MIPIVGAATTPTFFGISCLLPGEALEIGRICIFAPSLLRCLSLAKDFSLTIVGEAGLEPAPVESGVRSDDDETTFLRRLLTGDVFIDEGADDFSDAPYGLDRLVGLSTTDRLAPSKIVARIESVLSMDLLSLTAWRILSTSSGVMYPQSTEKRITREDSLAFLMTVTLSPEIPTTASIAESAFV